MNNKQRTALVFGLVVIVFMGLFPPYTDTTDGTGGFQFLFLKRTEKKPTFESLSVDTPQDAMEEVWSKQESIIKEWNEEQRKRLRRQLDVWMLLIQWVIVAAATGVFLVALSTPYCRAWADAARLLWRAAREDEPEPPTEQTEDAPISTQPLCYHCGQPIEQGQSPCLACGKDMDWSEE